MFGAVLCFCISLIITVKCTQYVDQKGALIPFVPLYDIGHTFLPVFRSNGRHVDLIAGFPLVVALISTFETTNIVRDLLISEIISSIAIIYTMRCVCICVTILPTPFIADGIKVLGGQHDMIFSGHMSMSLLGSLYVISMGGSVLWLVVTASMGVILVLNRWHYTIDIVVAVIVTSFVFLIQRLALYSLTDPRIYVQPTLL